MKYFIDTEFLEGTQDKTILGIKYAETKPTIDLISIGIVAEDGREYYAISKDFNVKEAWNRFDIKRTKTGNNLYKEYWIRDNVLEPIFKRWYAVQDSIDKTNFHDKFIYKEFKRLLNKYGKTNKLIAEEVKDFCITDYSIAKDDNCNVITWVKETPTILGVIKEMHNPIIIKHSLPEFYAYYADYDWVAFCWLFGKMVDLPKGFPMYCIDLKQMLDEKQKSRFGLRLFDGKLVNDIKKLPNYPKQTNEHNALSDARFNFELYKFLQKL